MADVTPKKMPKLDSSIDIIPIQGSSNDDVPKFLGRRTSQNKKINYMHRDPLILSRVQDYLYENEDKVYIDVAEMADCLMKKYRDYRNKKRDPFRLMVRRAYDEITETLSKKNDIQSKHNMDLDDDAEDDDDNDNEDIEIEIQSDNERSVNDVLGNELLKMYKKTTTSSEINTKNGNASDKELIDISSDDDDDADADETIADADETIDDPAHIEDIQWEKLKQTKNSTPIISKPSVTIKLTKNTNHNCPQIVKAKQLATKPIIPDVKINSSKIDDNKIKIINNDVEIGKNEKGKKRPRDKTADLSIVGGLNKKRREGTSTFSIIPQEKKYKYCDIGGYDKELKIISNLLIPMSYSKEIKRIGENITPTRGFLLHGPPGCGKSLVAHAIAGELDIPFLKVSAPELIAGVSGESESRIRELFDQALSLAPCLLFLDEIDALAPNRANAQKEMERRIVAQLLSCLDELSFKENGDKVLVLGATNRPETIDPALRRAGRFDREVSLGIPDKNCRAKILGVHLKNVALSDNVDILKIAAKSPGFVAADLVSLIREAAIAAIDRAFKTFRKEEREKKINDNVTIINIDAAIKISSNNDNDDNEKMEIVNDKKVENTINNCLIESQSKTNDITSNLLNNNEIEKIQDSNDDTLAGILEMLHNKIPISDEKLANLKIENIDFDTAFKVVQPSSKREGFATVPDVTWDDIGSLKEIREELKMAILAPVKYNTEFAEFGLTTPTGVLLCGPPGCGKTLLAKAVANEAEINFISVKGPELLNMYVGESEKAVRQCFIRARDSAPCVIFFDEIDALCPKRSDGDNSSTSRIVNQVLTEMDGVEGRKGVYLMAATNRPDIIDPAVMRPGRFDKILYVGLPTPDDRVDILYALTKKNGAKYADDTSMEAIGKSERCNGFTGADLAGLVREASTAAVKELMATGSKLKQVHMRHFEIAFDKVRPSVQEKEAKHYEKLKKQYMVSKPKIVETLKENGSKILNEVLPEKDSAKPSKEDQPETLIKNKPEILKNGESKISVEDKQEISNDIESKTLIENTPEISKDDKPETVAESIIEPMET